jgi:hypothetical protein
MFAIKNCISNKDKQDARITFCNFYTKFYLPVLFAPPLLLLPELPRLLLPLLGPFRNVRSPGLACDLLPALNLGFDDDGEDAEVLVLGLGMAQPHQI